MPLLVCLNFTHYGPKSSETGITTYLITDSMDELIRYVDKKYLSNSIAESKAEGEEDVEHSASFSFNHFEENPDDLQRAIDLGLNTKDSGIGYLSGPYHLITEFFYGTEWQTPDDDCYYGRTDYNWRNSRTITEEQIKVLLDLGIAIDVRGHLTWV